MIKKMIIIFCTNQLFTLPILSMDKTVNLMEYMQKLENSGTLLKTVFLETGYGRESQKEEPIVTSNGPPATIIEDYKRSHGESTTSSTTNWKADEGAAMDVTSRGTEYRRLIKIPIYDKPLESSEIDSQPNQ